MLASRNVFGDTLQTCCDAPVTGFYRDGRCNPGEDDFSAHVVCARVTAQFLDYTRSQGNDLRAPVSEVGFPGLKPGDRWCLCAARWKETLEASAAPPVILTATHERALEVVTLEDLKKRALDLT